MAGSKPRTRTEVIVTCEQEMLRSLQESDRYGEEYMRLKKINDQKYGAAARVVNRDDQPVKDAMGAWQWHAENVRVQAAAIQALVSLQEYRIAEYERVRDAQRRNNPEVPAQWPAVNYGSVGPITG